VKIDCWALLPKVYSQYCLAVGADYVLFYQVSADAAGSQTML
jgi:hypothetical protein